MDYHNLLTTQGDIIPVSDLLAKETVSLTGGGSYSTRWFQTRDKAGKVYVSVYDPLQVQVVVEAKLGTSTVRRVADSTDDIHLLAYTMAWKSFRVTLTNPDAETAHTVQCSVVVMQ